MDGPALHDDVAHLSALLGTWRGAGHGSYPTIESFDYLEEVTFGHVGKPFLAYTQKTRHADTNAPLHAESGYLRPVGTDAVEFVVAQPSGIIEIHSGPVSTSGSVVELMLTSSQVLGTPTAKAVTEVTRQLWFDPAVAPAEHRYTMAMAAVGQPLTHHLEATLHRQ